MRRPRLGYLELNSDVFLSFFERKETRLFLAVLEILDFPVYVRVGVFDNERLHGQQVLISTRLHIDDGRIDWNSDEISKTVDYGQIARVIESGLRARSFRLVESIVEEVGLLLCEHFNNCHLIEVTVEKRMLPKGLSGAKVRLSKSFHSNLTQSSI